MFLLLDALYKFTFYLLLLALRQIRSVHHSLSHDALVTLIRALVVTKLDYCCSVMVGVSGTLLRRLHTVGSQRCGAISVLGEEIGPHNATAPRTSLAEDHTAYPVPFVCPGLPLSAWYFPAIPRRDTTLDVWHRSMSSPKVWLYVDCVRAGDQAFPVAAARAWNHCLLYTNSI